VAKVVDTPHKNSVFEIIVLYISTNVNVFFQNSINTSLYMTQT